MLKEVAIETGAGFNADYVFSGDGAAPYRGRNAPPFEYAVRSRAAHRRARAADGRVVVVVVVVAVRTRRRVATRRRCGAER